MWKCVEHRSAAKWLEHGLPRRCAADRQWVDEVEQRTRKNGPCSRRSQVSQQQTCEGQMAWMQKW